MRTELLQLLVLATTALGGAGCDQSLSSRDSRPLSTTDLCSPSPQEPLVFYDETGAPSKMTPALSELELRRIIDAVAAQTRDRIWLICVKPSFSGGARAGVVIYLTPQQQTARIRTGCAYSIVMWDEKMDIAPPWKYVQVSKPDESFVNQPTLPSVGDLPFRRPNVVEPNSGKSWPMSDEEVISILDFVRDLSSYKSSATSRSSSTWNERVGRDAQKLPILWISRREDTIQVHLGYQHSGLWGHGVMVTVDRTPTGYRFVEGGPWVS